MLTPVSEPRFHESCKSDGVELMKERAVAKVRGKVGRKYHFAIGEAALHARSCTHGMGFAIVILGEWPRHCIEIGVTSTAPGDTTKEKADKRSQIAQSWTLGGRGQCFSVGGWNDKSSWKQKQEIADWPGLEENDRVAVWINEEGHMSVCLSGASEFVGTWHAGIPVDCSLWPLVEFWAQNVCVEIVSPTTPPPPPPLPRVPAPASAACSVCGVSRSREDAKFCDECGCELWNAATSHSRSAKSAKERSFAGHALKRWEEWSHGCDSETPTNRRRLSSSQQTGCLDKIVDDQFDRNMEIFKNHIKGKHGFLTFINSLLESGSLEASYNRKMMQNDVVVVKTFAVFSRYFKQGGALWLRDLLMSMNPTAFTPTDEMDEADAKKLKFGSDKAMEHLQIALNITDDCWLPHREIFAASAKVLARYVSGGDRLKYADPKQDLEVCGFYGFLPDQVVCLALHSFVPGDNTFPFIPTPVAGVQNWKLEGNVSAYAVLKHPDGDTYSLFSRFAAKYPEVFTDINCKPKRSLEDDGESPHDSLGDL